MKEPPPEPPGLHAEDARLASAGPRDVTLYTRPGCHLCEEAKAAIAPLLGEFDATLHEVNIENDPVLEARYGWDIPVIFVGARKAAKHRVDVEQFRRQLEQALWKKNTKLLLIGVGFTALATFAAFKILEFDRETINFTDQRVRLIVNSEVPIGSSRTRVNQFLDGKGWIHSDMGSKTQVMIRDASHRGLIRTDIRIRFLFDSEEKLVSYEIHDILTGP